MKDSTFCVACGGENGKHTQQCDRDRPLQERQRMAEETYADVVEPPPRVFAVVRHTVRVKMSGEESVEIVVEVTEQTLMFLSQIASALNKQEVPYAPTLHISAPIE